MNLNHIDPNDFICTINAFALAYGYDMDPEQPFIDNSTVYLLNPDGPYCTYRITPTPTMIIISFAFNTQGEQTKSWINHINIYEPTIDKIMNALHELEDQREKNHMY